MVEMLWPWLRSLKLAWTECIHSYSSAEVTLTLHVIKDSHKFISVYIRMILSKYYYTLAVVRVTAVSHKRSHSAKRAGGRLQLNMHAPYVCCFAWSDMVHSCMEYADKKQSTTTGHYLWNWPGWVKLNHLKAEQTSVTWISQCYLLLVLPTLDVPSEFIMLSTFNTFLVQ